MGFYDDHVLPRVIDFMCNLPPMQVLRERVTAPLRGEVLELGFGSGLNLPYYGNGVTRVHAIEPSTTGRKLAAKRIAASHVAVEWSGLDGQKLALRDASVDAVLSTFTFCTIPDLGAALAEARRVLRPGGSLHFLEHGRSHEPGVARWQDRLNPLQRRLAGGCNLNRAMGEYVKNAGFRIEALQTYYMPGPKVVSLMYEGRAVREHRPRK